MIARDWHPFGQGPARDLDRLLGLGRTGRARVPRSAVVAFLVSWPPLFMLAASEGHAFGAASQAPLVLDFVATARYALAVPLLVVAEATSVPRLCRIYRHFSESGIVADDDRARFEALGAATGRVLRSVWLELALVAVAYGITFGVHDAQYRTLRLGWDAGIIDGRTQRTPAGWWRMLVSHPLFLLLVLQSAARLCAWTRTLWGIARMELRLVASHADRVGGLGFVMTSVYAFLPLAFTFGVLLAARAAEGVIVQGASPWNFRHQMVAAPVVAVVIFGGPLMVFQRQLRRTKLQGTFDYGLLATRVARRFESQWLGGSRALGEDAFDTRDLSATSNLSGVVANVRQSRTIPLDSSVLVPLVVVVLLPFAPLVLAVVPIDRILEFVGKAIF